MQIHQQTLHMNVEDLSPCVEKDEKNSETFVSTNFDDMIEEFEESLERENKQPLSKSFLASSTSVLCVITYADKALLNSTLAIPGGLSQVKM
jgi:hypothetical protein